MPIGPVRRIDEARDNVVMAIDGRPALAVFYEDIGPELAQRPAPSRRVDLRRFAGARLRHRRLSRAQPDGDRPAPGLDRARGARSRRATRSCSAAAIPTAPAPISAACCNQLKGRLPGPPKAGIYVSCIARGAALFGEPGVESGADPRDARRFPADRVLRQWRDLARPAVRPYRRADAVHLSAAPCRERHREQQTMLRLFVGIEFPPELKLRLSLLCTGVPGAQMGRPRQFPPDPALHRRDHRGRRRPMSTRRWRGSRRRAFRCSSPAPACSAAAGRARCGSGSSAAPSWSGCATRSSRRWCAAGLEPEPRKFAPHVTLARLREPELDKLGHFLAAQRAVPRRAAAGRAFQPDRQLSDQGRLGVRGPGRLPADRLRPAHWEGMAHGLLAAEIRTVEVFVGPDGQADGRTHWDGVRNFQAANN